MLRLSVVGIPSTRHSRLQHNINPTSDRRDHRVPLLAQCVVHRFWNRATHSLRLITVSVITARMPLRTQPLPKRPLHRFIRLVVVIIIIIMHHIYVVRSLSIVPLPSRQSTRDMMILFRDYHHRHRSIRLPRVTTTTYRTVVTTGTPSPRSPLTRTMVHKMRLGELKEELERRGLLNTDNMNQSNNHSMKKPHLVQMLLAEIPSTVASKKGEAITASSTPTSSVVSSAEQYPVDQLQLDPHATYSMDVASVVNKDKAGCGIGIVMRQQQQQGHPVVVWQATRYYTGFRSVFECDFCAIVLALRWALQAFQLERRVEIHLSNVILVRQMTGDATVQKPTLQLLLGQVNQLLKSSSCSGSSTSETNAAPPVVFSMSETEHRQAAMALAHHALKTKTSSNLGDTEHNQFMVDPMIEMTKVSEPKSRNGPNVVGTEESEDPQLALKFQGFVKPSDVVIDPTLHYKLRFDGGSRGNPGIAGAGIVLYDDHDREIWRGVKFLGRSMSNNAAEYSALNLGLSRALSMGIQHLYCEGDSQLVVKQLNGLYKVKNADMQSYFQETQSLISQFKSCKVSHIRREFNKRADELANQGKNTIQFHSTWYFPSTTLIYFLFCD